MRIQNNVMAMNTHRMYTSNNNAVSRSAEKLSSGYRINRAGDDAAGLAISEKMRAQVRGLNMASKNSQDAISLVQTAEGALQEVHSMLQRMTELSVQSATGTNADFDRTQIAAEFEQLKGEIDQIASTTDFNGMKLLDGSLATVGKTSYAAANKTPAIVSTSTADDGTDVTSTTVLDITKLAVGDKIVMGTVGSVTLTDTNLASATALKAALDGVTGASFDAATGVLEVTKTGSVDADDVAVTQDTNVARGSIDLAAMNRTHGAGFTVAGKNFRLEVGGETISGFNEDTDFKVSVGANDDAKAVATQLAAVITAKLTNVTATSAGTTTINLVGTDITSADSVQTFRGGLEIQVGAEQGNNLNVSVQAMNSTALNLKDISIDTQAKAGDAITATRKAIDSVSEQRAALGAMQNRLEHKISNLDNTAENLQAAESRIRDVDIAKEMTTYTKNNILSQASTAMLAQANAAPQNVLSLLQ